MGGSADRPLSDGFSYEWGWQNMDAARYLEAETSVYLHCSAPASSATAATTFMPATTAPLSLRARPQDVAQDGGVPTWLCLSLKGGTLPSVASALVSSLVTCFAIGVCQWCRHPSDKASSGPPSPVRGSFRSSAASPVGGIPRRGSEPVAGTLDGTAVSDSTGGSIVVGRPI